MQEPRIHISNNMFVILGTYKCRVLFLRRILIARQIVDSIIKKFSAFGDWNF